ncbi:symmetrical bis(5'-nucleosyl)-tetraphosphatase [Thalassotalea ganghwensis]
MSTYFIGDIQGCFNELDLLLNRISFNRAKDQLWVAGDMVARGPNSLETMELLLSLGDSVKAVLGNHDLHLLAVAAGHKTAKKVDKLAPLLNSPKLGTIIDWLSTTPLMRKLDGEKVYMSHAGLSPQWSIRTAKQQAKFAQAIIQSTKRDDWLKVMYGEAPHSWHNVHTEKQAFRYTINAFTRMRYCFLDGSLDFSCKTAPEGAPKKLAPWYELVDLPPTRSWLFGHWAALMGKCPRNNIHALDTGCVWGGALTLLHWEKMTRIQQKSLQ